MPFRDFIEETQRQIRLLPKRRSLFAFLHIPKTAGTALVTALRAQFEEERVLDCREVERLGDMSGRSLRWHYDFIHGHFGMMDIRDKATSFATILRDPVDRILSLYNYWRTEPLDGAHVYTDGIIDPALRLARELSFRDFVFADHRRILDDIQNAQAYQLASANYHKGRVALADCSEDAIFDLACRNLARMQAVGVVEDMPGFQARLRSSFGAEIEIDVVNKTQTKIVSHVDLCDETLTQVRALNRIDQRLYDHVRGL